MDDLFRKEAGDLLIEFLSDMADAGLTKRSDEKTRVEFRNKWQARDDIGLSMRGFYSSDLAFFEKAAAWRDMAVALVPAITEWQISMFWVCSKRSLRRIEKMEMEQVCKTNRNWGMF